MTDEFKPIAYLRDVGDDEDPCFVPCAKDDPGSFGVYSLGQFADANADLIEALTQAREAIASLPEYALGGVVNEATDGSDRHFQYPISAELLAFIDAALSKAAA